MKLTFNTLAFLLILIASMSSALAEELAITTEFKPSASNPAHNEFTNTTPVSGFCANWTCPTGTFSLRTDITATNRIINTNSSDLRHHTYQHLDANWRTATLYDKTTRRSISVQFRISLLGMRFIRSTASWQGSDFNNAGRSPNGNCTGVSSALSNSQFEYAWNHPEGINTCDKNISNIDLNDVRMDRISIGYEMKVIESPMTIANGEYVGSITYNIGNNKEIDLGQADYTDNELKINITASVQHEFRVASSGPTRIELEPTGGWDIVRGGATEARLEGRSSFSLTASAPFGIYTECEHSRLGSCALKMDGAANTVPLNVAVTMPNMRVRGTNEIVNNMSVPMRGSSMQQVIVEPITFSNAAESPIAFSVSAPDSRTMLANPGSTWKGTVTLVFDSELPFAIPSSG